MRYFLKFALLFFLAVPMALAQPARVEPAKVEPVLGPGDVVKVSVFQNADLSVEARISEGGQINVPLIGAVTVGGLTITAAERRIEAMLRDGGFVLKPQVTIQTVRILS